MLKKIFLFCFLLFLFCFLLFLFWWSEASSPVKPTDEKTQIIVIPQGWGVEKIGKELKKKNLIKSVLAFKIIVAREGVSSQLQAGDFRFSPSMNLEEIVQNLTHGTLDIWITIPEGLRREEIGEIFAFSWAEKGGEFDFKKFVIASKDLEGLLFPDTYLIPKTASYNDIIKILHNNFLVKSKNIISKSSLSQEQIIILASLVEREAKHDQDRPIIAGILLKRLKKGWPLQVDATLQYALANTKCKFLSKNCQWWPKVTGEDKEINSPYNTYKNLGLPPAAICNPGLKSIKAAANPQDSPYWFYLSDSLGNIYYAKTLKEHEANIKAYL